MANKGQGEEIKGDFRGIEREDKGDEIQGKKGALGISSPIERLYKIGRAHV